MLNVVQSDQISGGCNKTLLFLHQPFGGPLSVCLPAARTRAEPYFRTFSSWKYSCSASVIKLNAE